MSTKLQTKKKRTVKSSRSVKDQDVVSTVNSWRDEDRQNRETLEFIQAVDRFKRRTQKAFPTWSEVLDILRSLGYRKAKP